MEDNIIKLFAVTSLAIFYFGGTKIDKILRNANVETHIIGKVNFITLILGAIITLLSGYILFFGD